MSFYASRSGQQARELDPWDGILLVDKPAGVTSHDVVDRIRRTFLIRKVGHGGTLDPMATGLLIMLLGRGTRLSNAVMGQDKTYEGTMHLGITTDSEDVDGAVTGTADFTGVTRAALEAEMKKWLGDIQQIPPMVSAIKKDGVPLYKLARKGQEIVREPRWLHIFEFTLLDFAPPQASFRLRCSKGTYVRTLCADIGRALGCGAHLAKLRRTQSGNFNIADALTLPTLLALKPDDILPHIIPAHEVRDLTTRAP
ncbi:MAG: tRNA pseudouridine(55) synthase TruB [Verrucomicrobia bacterium]|nr:MAG: tRNA pseudouridine(55) synthase TruB [Verrucomicrobiota bacterium]